MSGDEAHFGLLLDVDGPIASPQHRAIVQPTIVPDMIALLAAGNPIVFNTGRSAHFLSTQVFTPLLKAGLPQNARVHGVCEKGAVWLTLKGDGHTALSVEDSLAPPAEFVRGIERIVKERYTDSMFFDDTKLAMVSVEQNFETSSDDYFKAQAAFDDEAFALLVDLGIGVEMNDRVQPDSAGKVMMRIEPTIISTDIEATVLGKDYGAERALNLLREDGVLPTSWRTVGDSRSDYKMSDWLHANRFSVAHVDVRPAEGVPDRPYPVLHAVNNENDVAGAAYLRWMVEWLNGTAGDESGFDRA